MTEEEIAGLIGVIHASGVFSMPPPGATGPLPPNGGLSKAFIRVEGGPKITCWFNPNKYTVSKGNTWNEQPRVGQSLPHLQFGGGQARKMKFELLFDDSDRRDGDVSKMTDQLFAAMDVKDASPSNKNAARPPTIEFGWGSTRAFKAVIDQLSVEFNLFRPDGVPVRAMATLDLRQADDVADGSPASAAGQLVDAASGGLPDAAGLTSHLVRDGDSLQSIAQAAYGEANKWRHIAEANGIDNPMKIARGVALSIPRIMS